MIRSIFTSGAIVLFYFPSPLFADTWTTPDRLISVERPTASQFDEVQLGPPFLAAWTGKDGNPQLGIVQITIPPGMKLIRKSLEEGFQEEIHGKITSSEVENLSGYTVFKMSARGSLQNRDVFMTQSVFVVNDKVYKVMASSLEKDTLDSMEVRQFMDSLRFLQKNPTAENVQIVEKGINGNHRKEHISLTHELSKKIGGLSLLLLLVCIVFLFLRKRQTIGKHLRKETPKNQAMPNED